MDRSKRKQPPVWQGLLAGTLLSLLIYLAGLLLIAFLAVKGGAGEESAGAPIRIAAALAAFAGAMYTGPRVGWNRILTSLLIAALLSGSLLLWGRILYPTVWPGPSTASLPVWILLAGCAAGVLQSQKRRKHKRLRK